MPGPRLAWKKPNVSLDQANGGREPEPLAGNPCGTAPRPFRRLVSLLPAELRFPGLPGFPDLPKELFPMAETTVRRRVRHVSRTTDSDRKNAAAALQRALDRRDNGGQTGH